MLLWTVTWGKAPVIKEGIPIKAGEEDYLVAIEVIPLADTVEPY